MITKRFRFQVIFRIILLSLTIYAFIYIFDTTQLYATLIIIALFGVYQVYSLVKLMDKTNQRLTQFLEAIRHADFSQSFKSADLGRSFQDLNEAFARVMEDFQQIRGDKEEHFRYLQTVVQHVGVGLIAYDTTGKVELINRAAKKLTGIQQIANINALRPFSEELVDKLLSMKPRNRYLIKVQSGEDLLQLVIYTTEFRLRGRPLMLASVQNIQSELEEQEMEAWQKLIRVLTHEIMNSMTPISSLAKTVDELITEKVNIKLPADEKEELTEIREAVNTIQKRSEGLIHFVESYRKLTRIPKPNFQEVGIRNLIDRVIKLMDRDLQDKEVEINTLIKPEQLIVLADPELIEQVLINLIKNSIDALTKITKKIISVSAFRDQRGRITIEVTDNGQGISPEARDKLFIPFFTTKKSGSGIGLSLSRQIMRQHLGSISLSTDGNDRTTFRLIFA